MTEEYKLRRIVIITTIICHIYYINEFKFIETNLLIINNLLNMFF